MFINREKELELLENEYLSPKASFTVIYGRRRVGKTALISKYISNKPCVYFYASEAKPQQQINQFASQFFKFLNKPFIQNINFNDIEQLLLFFVDQMPKDKKIILAIDEYQELAKSIFGISSILQRLWDLNLQSEKIHLILCGSVISMMHSEILSYTAPLYGRRTSNIHLKPLLFANIKNFLPNLSQVDQMNVYAAFGTIPKYLEIYDERKTFISNIRDKILDKNSYLYQEVRFLLKEEIGDVATYFSILQTIALGETKIGNIAKRLNVKSNILTRYLLKLIDLDIIERDIPITEKHFQKSKLGRYRIKDNFISFWFKYVFQNFSLLELGQTEFVIDEILKTFNMSQVSFAFEEYVKELILSNPMKYLGYIPKKLGRWWNNNEEIDIISIGDEKISFIECKWWEQPVGYKVYNALKNKSQLIETSLNKQYLIFSKSGFKNNIKDIKNFRYFSYLM